MLYQSTTVGSSLWTDRRSRLRELLYTTAALWLQCAAERPLQGHRQPLATLPAARAHSPRLRRFTASTSLPHHARAAVHPAL